MTKSSSAQIKSSQSPALAHSASGLLARQHTLGSHICVQREAVDQAVHPAAPAMVRDVLASPGSPLDASTRSAMEPRFGQDFSRVRVHTDERAAKSVRAVGASAYTAGNHLAFGAGKYSPATQGGQQLMAHELTHVVQQASGPVASTKVADGLSVSHRGDPFERAASETGKRVGSESEPSPQTSSDRSRCAATGRQSGALVLQRADPTSDQIASQTQSASDSASAAQTSASAGIASAIGGGISALAGVASAYAAIRSANFAERSAVAAEDPPTAEPTTGGLSVTDADISEIKALEKGTDADTTTKTTGTEESTPTGKDVESTTGTDVEDTTAGPTGKKKTSKSGTGITKRAGTKTKSQSTAEVFKSKDEPDFLTHYKLLNVNQGTRDNADFDVSIRSNKQDIKDGGTEPPESTGYLGGTSEANASVIFKARAAGHNDDGSAKVRLTIGGTNTPPRKTIKEKSFFGSQGPEVNKNYGVQRFRAAIEFDADPKKRPPVVDPKYSHGVQIGDGVQTPLVTVSLPDGYKPAGRQSSAPPPAKTGPAAAPPAGPATGPGDSSSKGSKPA